MNFLHTFLNMLVNMSPYLLLGFLIAGLLHVFVPASFYRRYLQKENFRSVLLAALIGIPLPLCSCGVIPTAISLRKEGASKGAVTSFLIATPQTGIDSILATYSLLGLSFALYRPFLALFTALAGGFITSIFFLRHEKTANSSAISQKSEIPLSFSDKMKEVFRYGFIEMMQNVGKWLVIGLIIGAAITVFVPDSFFVMLNGYPFLSMLVVLVVAIPMYLCATGSIPIAAALIMKGLSPGAALVMLMAGPAASVASIMVVGKALGKKQLLLYLGSIIVGALLGGLVIDYVLPSTWFNVASAERINASAMHLGTFGIVSSVLFTIIFFTAFIMKFLKKNKKLDVSENATAYLIGGMSCNHCRESVEKSISTLPDVKQVNVDLNNNCAYVEGGKEDEIKKAVESAGFEYKGKKN